MVASQWYGLYKKPMNYSPPTDFDVAHLVMLVVKMLVNN